MYTDTFKSSMKSARGYNCAQIYCTGHGWSRVFPLKREADVHLSLDELFHRYGVPESILSDGAKSLTLGEFKKTAQKAHCPLDSTDPYSPWQNRAEREIQEIKRLTGRWMMRTSTPKPLWDYCVELAAKVRSNIAHDYYPYEEKSLRRSLRDALLTYHIYVNLPGLIGF